MKQIKLLLIIMLISNVGFSQNGDLTGVSSKPIKEKNMKYVPAGNFNFKEDNSSSQFSVDAFWMSQEITNKEFRLFTESIKQHPNDTLARIDIEKALESRTNYQDLIVFYTYKEVYNIIYEESGLSEKPGSENYKYRNSKKYNNYPVINISYRTAFFYCLWRTKEANNDDLILMPEFRLPTEFEWKYANSEFSHKKQTKNQTKLQKVKTGNKNSIGLYHLNDNVSEWTDSGFKNEMQIICGNSYKISEK